MITLSLPTIVASVLCSVLVDGDLEFIGGAAGLLDGQVAGLDVEQGTRNNQGSSARSSCSHIICSDCVEEAGIRGHIGGADLYRSHLR